MKQSVVTVGVNEYEDRGIAPLSCAEKDAVALELCLQQQCGFVGKSLTGRLATRKRILEEVRAGCRDLGPHDLFVFVFSGHAHDDAEERQILLPYDASLANLEVCAEGEGLPVRAIEKVSASCGAARVLVIDACRRPLARNSRDSHARQKDIVVGDMERLVEREASGAAPLVVMQSCSPGQRSIEVEELSHGVFCLAFRQVLEAHLREGRELILPGAAERESCAAAKRLLQVQRRADSQEPVCCSRGSVVLVRGRVPPPGTPAVAAPRAAEAELRVRLARFVQERKGDWTDAAWLRLQTDLHDEGLSAGWKSAELNRLLEAEKRRWSLETERRAGEERERREREAAERKRIPLAATKEQPWENSLGMRFVPVPGTKVLFCVWETRVQDYGAFVRATGREWPEPGFEQGPTHPAVNVSWEDAQAFCAWLTEEERKSGRLPLRCAYRLPTDAEWSWAVGIGDRERGSTPADKDMKVEGIYPWGTAWPPPKGAGNYDPSLKVDDYRFTSPVGSFAANALGLFDLGGNVWEWCEDWYSAGQSVRVLRGASWLNVDPGNLLSSFRGNDSPDYRYHGLGFRCVVWGGDAG